MTADELVKMAKKANERKKQLENEALAIAHAVVEKALKSIASADEAIDEEKEVVKDGTRDILFQKYHGSKQKQ